MKHFRTSSFIITLGLAVTVGAVLVRTVQAQPQRAGTQEPDIPIRTEVVIPGQETELLTEGTESFFRGKVQDLADYLDIVYDFLLAIVGLVAAAMMMIGGFQYLTAGGDAARVSAAKTKIGNALVGLILVLTSYLLLNTINPALVNLKTPDIKQVRTELAFMPWCEDLVYQIYPDIDKEYKRERDSLGSGKFYRGVLLSWNSRLFNMIGNGRADCGVPNYIVTPEGNRAWCAFRGRLRGTTNIIHPLISTKPSVQAEFDFNSCPDDSIGGGAFFATCNQVAGLEPADLDRVFTPEYEKGVEEIGMDQQKLIEELQEFELANPGIDHHNDYPKDLYKKWDTLYNKAIKRGEQAVQDYLKEKGFVSRVAFCASCNTLTINVMKKLRWPTGDAACQLWQNNANNGNPNTPDFSLSKMKLHVKGPCGAGRWAKDRKCLDNNWIYYCGYSDSRQRCDFAPLYCPKVTSCKDYGKEAQAFECEYVDKSEFKGVAGGAMAIKVIDPPGVECANVDLGSTMFLEAGVPKHLAPICAADPCGVQKGCRMPGQVLDFVGLRTFARVVTGGLLFDVECKGG